MVGISNASPARSAAFDAELCERVRAGDKGAFEQLMRRHNRTLFRTARAILRDDAEAEEAVQDAYLHAYRTLADNDCAERSTSPKH